MRERREGPDDRAAGFEVTSKETKVVYLRGRATSSQCFESQSAADAAQKGITPAPEGLDVGVCGLGLRVDLRGPVARVPTTSQGPGSKLGAYCLTDISNTELKCYTDYAAAQAAFKSMTTKVAQTSWCISAPGTTESTSPAPTPTPPPAGKQKPTSTPSAAGGNGPSATAERLADRPGDDTRRDGLRLARHLGLLRASVRLHHQAGGADRARRA